MAQIQAQQFIDVVAQLLQRPFGSRNTEDQKLTVQQPRPMPVLQLKTGNRSFQKDWYSKKDWLCGSVSSKQSLWHVILFTDVSIRRADVSYHGCREDFY